MVPSSLKKGDPFKKFINIDNNAKNNKIQNDNKEKNIIKTEPILSYGLNNDKNLNDKDININKNIDNFKNNINNNINNNLNNNIKNNFNNNIKNNNINNLNNHINNDNMANNQFLREIPKPVNSLEQTAKKVNENNQKINININIPQKKPNNETNQKITLYNLDNEDKSLLKNMEKNNAFIISDISFLNRKNITNYNISLSNFDIKKLLIYYINLVKENKKEQIYITNLKNNISGLRGQLMTIKKNEIKTKSDINKEKEKKSINLIEINNKYINNENKKEKLDILSRYENDLNYFEKLINNMNEEIKKI